MTTTDDLRRLNDESRVRLAGVQEIRERHQLIARESRRRLAASRLLLAGHRPAPQV